MTTIFKIQKNYWPWILLIVLYLCTRIVNLGSVPIFTDEAIYLHWSQAISSGLKFLYLPLTDGKPPLFMWATAIVMKLLPALDPLYAGRLVSIAAGLLSLGGIYFTAYQLFKDKKIAYISSLLYILAPFTFFYDRFGVVDGLLTTFATWAFGLGVYLVKNLQLKIAVILGIIIGLEWLTKTPAMFSLIFLIPLFIFRPNTVRFGALLVIVFAIARLIYSGLFFLPQAYVITLKNQEFILTTKEFLSEPFRLFLGNSWALLRWEAFYLTLPLLIPLLWGLLAKPKEFIRQKLVILITFIGYFLFLSFFNKVIYPRYLLLFTPLLLTLIALGMARILKIFKTKLGIVILLILLSTAVYTDFKIVTDPANAPIADNDSEQYLNSWPAGKGIREVNTFFVKECQKYSKITLGVEGTFGLTPFAIDIYQKDHPCLETKAYWPGPDKLPSEISQAAATHPTYYLIYQRDKTPVGGGKLELIDRYFQGHGRDSLKLYKVIPES